MPSHEILTGLVMGLILVACTVATGCTETTTESAALGEQHPKEIGTYICLLSDTVYRCTLFDDGTCEMDYITGEGFADSVKTDYTIGTFKGVAVDSKYSLDQFANDSIYFAPDISEYVIQGVSARDFSDSQYYKINMGKPMYLSQRGEDYWLFYPTESEGYTYGAAKTVAGGTPCEIYILGTPGEPFDGDITISSINVKSESVEGKVPAIFQYGCCDDLSIFAQKLRDNQKKLSVVIYDTNNKEIRNYGTTTAGYGVVSLTS